MVMSRRILLCAVLAVLPTWGRADDTARARAALLQLGQSLQAREAGRVRELLAPEAVVAVTVVEPDSAPTFSFGREEFLQTYTALWRFSSEEKVEMTLRSFNREGDGGWSAVADIRERMRVLGEDYRRESIVTCRVRKRNDRFVIDAVSMKTVIR